jgi:hypothetical protein
VIDSPEACRVWHNAFGISARTATSAAYGEGLLLRALSPGRHTIRVTSITPAGDQTRTFIIHAN